MSEDAVVGAFPDVPKEQVNDVLVRQLKQWAVNCHVVQTRSQHMDSVAFPRYVSLANLQSAAQLDQALANLAMRQGR